MRVRRAQPRDLDELIAFERELFAERAYSRFVFRQFMECFGPLFLVARVNDELVGYLIGGTKVERAQGYVLSLAIRPDMQRMGIAVAMARGLRAEYLRLGIHRLSLAVSPDNKRALELYKDFGFDEVCDDAAYHGSGEPRTVLTIDLLAGAGQQNGPEAEATQAGECVLYVESKRNTDHGGPDPYRSVVASRAIEEGEMLARFRYRRITRKPTRYTVQVEENTHIELEPEYLQYINHSCAPNVFFDVDASTLVALRPIAVGAELAFFYPSTEWDMSEPFQCCCNADQCLGRVSGAKYLEPHSFASHRFSKAMASLYASAQRAQASKGATT